MLYFILIIMLLCLIGFIFHGDYKELRFYMISFISFSGLLFLLIKGNLNRAISIAVVLFSLDIFSDIMQLEFISYEKIVETIMEAFLSYVVIGLLATKLHHIIYTIVSNTGLTILHAVLLYHYAYLNKPFPYEGYRYFLGGVIAVLLIGFVALANAKINSKALFIVQHNNEKLRLSKNVLEKEVQVRTFELEKANQELERINKELLAISMFDSMTGIYNRRKILDKALEVLKKTEEDKKTLSIVILDIDHFKKINDIYGHAAGDLAIKSVVDICKRCLRETDHLGRLGGEEFLIILENTGLLEAYFVLESMRRSIEQTVITTPKNHQFNLTISIGISELKCNESLEELTQRADEALYISKRNGRNRTTLYDYHQIV